MAARHGFARAVLVPARTLDEYRPNAEAVRHGILRDPRALLAQAKSVLVVAMPFLWYAAWPKQCAEVSVFYFISQQAQQSILALAGSLRDMGITVDERQKLPAKLWGREAGLGVIGRNSLLMNPAWGSCYALRTLVTDIPVAQVPRPADMDGCAGCRRCVEACPTGALDGRGGVDTEKCLRAHMLQGKTIPEELRPLMGTRLVGCEICQRVCPYNTRIPCVEAEDTQCFSIDRLLRGKPEDLTAVGKHIGPNYARKLRIQTQAALAAGNSGRPEYLPPLAELAGEGGTVAEHARWAMERIIGNH